VKTMNKDNLMNFFADYTMKNTHKQKDMIRLFIRSRTEQEIADWIHDLIFFISETGDDDDVTRAFEPLYKTME